MIANRWERRRLRRSGFGLIEMLITGVLIAAGMAATAQVVSWVARERRAVERRERAVVEAANLMERIKTRSWTDLTPEATDAIRLSDSSKTFLPGATLKIQVIPREDPPVRKQVVVEIRWSDRSGQLEAPVRLVSWTYRGLLGGEAVQ